MIDAHVHLTDPRLAQELDAVLDRAKAAGLRGLVSCGTSPDDWDAVIQLIQNHRDSSLRIHGAIGLHPWFADQWTPAAEARLEVLLQTYPALAIGEIGLDRCCDVPLSLQLKAFRRQMEWAAALSRPVSIHCVRCWSELLSVLKHFPSLPAGGMVHAFSGSQQVLSELLETPLSISFGAAVTNPHATRAHIAAQWVPSHRYVMETDAPDMLPFPLQKQGLQVNEPANLLLIAQALASVRHEPLSTIIDQTCTNAYKLFNLDKEVRL